MSETLKAALGIAALCSPFLIMLVLLVTFERRDGLTRFVVKDGKCRRRSTINRK